MFDHSTLLVPLSAKFLFMEFKSLVLFFHQVLETYYLSLECFVVVFHTNYFLVLLFDIKVPLSLT